MNKKGFTLVELLATLGILSIVAGIAAVAYTSIVDNSRLKIFKTYEQTMYTEVMATLMNSLINPEKASAYPKNHEVKKYTLSEMIENNEIEPFNNPRNKDDLCLNSYVEVKREDSYAGGSQIDAFQYKVCLICTESDYNVDGDSCLFIPED